MAAVEALLAKYLPALDAADDAAAEAAAAAAADA